MVAPVKSQGKFFYRPVVLFTFMVFLIASCNTEDDYTGYVNPFVGAADNGHCMPGACVPFGLIQAGPQSGNCSWAYTAGYQYKDTILYGFTQNRLSGTGVADLGDLLILPFTGDPQRQSYSSAINKKTEKASPGYYTVGLEDFDITAEMTASSHTAFHRYTYKGKVTPHLLIDFQSGGVNSVVEFNNHIIKAEQNFISSTKITGFCKTKVWLERTYYYAIEFSRPIQSKTILSLRDTSEKAHRYVLDFDLKPGDELMIKISLSSTGIEGALENLEAEIPDWNFEDVKQQANRVWNSYLSRVKAEGSTEQKNIFYTSMYHLFIHPNNIADAGSEPFYSTLSLWDTYRAAHPLYTLLAPEHVDGFSNSFIRQYDQQGFLPIWALWGGETYCMIGNHAVPVIVDAYLKGFRGFDAEKAYTAVKNSLKQSHLNSDWETYDKYGYYPFDLIKVESVSRTLESGYDDYCASLFAESMGKQEDYRFFKQRSEYYKNLFDPETGLMRPKDSSGKWKTPFNTFLLSHASTSGGDYTEGNAWQYSWHIQHDVNGLIDLYGGKKSFTKKLDSLFTMKSKIEGSGFVSDVTGLIGQYAHGNEPSHHIVYLYTLADQPGRTQELVSQICKTQYQDKVDGLCGNDDCGQMSAWYIFSVLGFYPVNPCGGEYVLGAPQLPRATIKLSNGKTFTIVAENYSQENIYVQSVELNEKSFGSKSISHDQIMNGGILKFIMGKGK